MLLLVVFIVFIAEGTTNLLHPSLEKIPFLCNRSMAAGDSKVLVEWTIAGPQYLRMRLTLPPAQRETVPPLALQFGSGEDARYLVITSQAHDDEHGKEGEEDINAMCFSVFAGGRHTHDRVWAKSITHSAENTVIMFSLMNHHVGLDVMGHDPLPVSHFRLHTEPTAPHGEVIFDCPPRALPVRISSAPDTEKDTFLPDHDWEAHDRQCCILLKCRSQTEEPPPNGYLKSPSQICPLPRQQIKSDREFVPARPECKTDPVFQSVFLPQWRLCAERRQCESHGCSPKAMGCHMSEYHCHLHAVRNLGQITASCRTDSRAWELRVGCRSHYACLSVGCSAMTYHNACQEDSDAGDDSHFFEDDDPLKEKGQGGSWGGGVLYLLVLLFAVGGVCFYHRISKKTKKKS